MLTIWVISRLIWGISNTQRKCYHQNWFHGISLWMKEKQKISPLKGTDKKHGKNVSSWARCRYWRGCKAKKSTFNECRELNKEIFLREIRIEVKVRPFNCYLSSVFLHNWETWTLTKTRSQVITRREPSWFGHLFYLSDDTPAKIALQYSLRQTKKPRHRQWTTWISMMKMKLLGMRLEWEAANRLAEDRLVWNNFIEWVSPMGLLHAN